MGIFKYDVNKFASSFEKTVKATTDAGLAATDANGAQGIGAPDADVADALSSAVASVQATQENVTKLGTAFSTWESSLYDLITQGYTEDLLIKLGGSGNNWNDILELTEKYMKDILALPAGNRYTGNNRAYTSTNDPINDLIAKGMPPELANNLSLMMCEALASTSYTREGTVSAAYLYTGILAAYGLRLGYYCDSGKGSFYRTGDFYFGSGSNRLGMLDCVNFVKVIFRSVGIDPVATSFPNYARNSNTPEDECWALYGSNYFKNGKPGDVLTNKGQGHIMMILERTDTGYYYAEEADGACIQFKTFEALAKEGYGVTNMDSVYNNTSTWVADSNTSGLNPIPGYKGRYGDNLFIQPEVYREMYPNLSDEAYQAMIKNYEANNQWNNSMPYDQLPDSVLESKTHWGIPPTPEPTPEVVPGVTPGVMEGTIFPDSSYIDGLPPLAFGTLGYNEISSHHIMYEINDMTEEMYNTYISTFESAGYTLSEDGTMWIKGEYMLTVEMTDEDTMMVMLQTMFGGRSNN